MAETLLAPMHLTPHGWGLRAGIFSKRRILLAFVSHIGSGYLHDKAEADNIRSSGCHNLRLQGSPLSKGGRPGVSGGKSQPSSAYAELS
jgi:hypothetical protein